MNMKCRRLIAAVAVLCLVLGLSACKGNQNQVQYGGPDTDANGVKRQVYQYTALDTDCTVTVFGDFDDGFGKIAEEATNTYGNLLGLDPATNLYAAIKNNDVLQLNDEQYETIKKGYEICQLSGGSFDLTIGSLTRLWNIGQATQPPAEYEILREKEYVDYQKLQFDDANKQIIMPTYGQVLDVGGLAKGYAGQRVAQALQEAGYTCGIVDLGGNVTVYGTREGTDAFRVGIQNPLDDETSKDIIGEIQCNDVSVVTSGSYERYFEYEGKRYHHILNPATGYPAETDLLSVTIVSKDGAYADALSTAAYVKGFTGCLEMLNNAISEGKIEGAVLVNNRSKVLVLGNVSFQITNSDFSMYQ